MREGTVDQAAVDSVLVGVAGCGKSLSLERILDLEERGPAYKRVSTPCTEAAVRTITQVTLGEGDGVLVRMEGDQYFNCVAHTAGELGRSLQHTASPPRERRASVPKFMQELEEKMERQLAGGEEKEEEATPTCLLYQLRWNRLTDSGGQPQFLEILPIFIHHISVGLIVLKLNERLDAFPWMEFYDEEGERVGEPYKSTFSQEQMVRHFMRGLASQGGGKQFKLLFIGTHRDRQGECNESLQEKNDRLKEIVCSFEMEDNVIYHGEDVVFPINALNPEAQDWQVIRAVRQVLVASAEVPAVQIPIRWFGLELALQRFVLETGQAVLPESQCLQLVAHFHFDQQKLGPALDYLHQAKHIFYYQRQPRGTGLVVAETAFLQKKLSQAVSYSIQLSSQAVVEPKWRKFRLYGILHGSCMERFDEGYIRGVFGGKELLEVFERLCIVSGLGREEYLMPCVLPVEETACCNPEPHSQAAAAMVLEFPGGGPMLGLYCGLVCFLLSSGGYELAKKRNGDPLHISRSSVHLTLAGHPGKLTFNDPLSTFFTLTYHGPGEGIGALQGWSCVPPPAGDHADCH